VEIVTKLNSSLWVSYILCERGPVDANYVLRLITIVIRVCHFIEVMQSSISSQKSKQHLEHQNCNLCIFWVQHSNLFVPGNLVRLGYLASSISPLIWQEFSFLWFLFYFIITLHACYAQSLCSRKMKDWNVSLQAAAIYYRGSYLDFGYVRLEPDWVFSFHL